MTVLRRCNIIGDYAVMSRLGGGRYGVCFLAEDRTGAKVVLKRFRKRMWQKNKGKNHHEAVILSGLHHPAVPDILGVVNCRRGYYFVLQFMEGVSLEQYLFREKKHFSSDDVYRIGSSLFEILLYLHSRNVVHGDISIGNVIDSGEKVSLIDFGLARYAGEGTDSDRFSLDYARMADVLLYLLYSEKPEEEIKRDTKKRKNKNNKTLPWYEELPLPEGQKTVLMRLLGLREPFKNTLEAMEMFHKEFSRRETN